MDHRGRLERVRSRLGELGHDALFVTNRTDVRWLIGFTGSAGDLLVTPDRLMLLTDGRYTTQARQQSDEAGVEAQIESDHTSHTAVLSGAVVGMRSVALQADHITWSRQRSLSSGALRDVETIAVEGLVSGLRVVKEAPEIERMQAAASIADQALQESMGMIVPGTMETELALAIDSAMRRLGASEPAFDTIVASGPNSAVPHHQPGARRLEEGDLVVIDFGATVDGYRSDMTRTFPVGVVGETGARILQVVTRAQSAGVDALGAGVSVKDVDEASRSVIRDAGWVDAFVHGTGHGVGLDIHEEPRVSSLGETILGEGMVVTVEPGVYLPGIGGARVEDMLVVTATGSRSLTRFPKQTA